MCTIAKFTASRIILKDIEVLENVGRVRINVSRFGDLSIRSEAVLSPRSTTPIQAGKNICYPYCTQNDVIILPDSNDYVVFEPINLVYLGGNRREMLATFEIEIIDDSIVERRESFEIVAKATRNLYIPFPVMKITILDDDGIYVHVLIL